MALNEATVRKLCKEEIIKLALEYPYKFDWTLTTINDIQTDLSELKKYYEKLESDLIVTKLNCATKWSFWSFSAGLINYNPGLNAWHIWCSRICNW